MMWIPVVVIQGLLKLSKPPAYKSLASDRGDVGQGLGLFSILSIKLFLKKKHIFNIQGLYNPLLRVVKEIKPPLNSNPLHISPPLHIGSAKSSFPHFLSILLQPTPRTNTTVNVMNPNFQNAQTRGFPVIFNCLYHTSCFR